MHHPMINVQYQEEDASFQVLLMMDEYHSIEWLPNKNSMNIPNGKQRQRFSIDSNHFGHA